MAYLVYFGLPVVLLLSAFRFFSSCSVTSIVAVLTVRDVPTDALQTYMFGSLDNFPLLAVPFFVLAGEIMAQGGIARRIIAMVMAIVGGMRGSLAVTTVAASELFGAMSHTADRHRRGHGPDDLSRAQGGRLQRALRRRPHRLFGRDRGRHPAVDRDDPLRGLGRAVRRAVVHRGHPAEPLDRRHRCRLRHELCQDQERPARHRAHWATIWKTSKEASWSIGTLAVIFGGIYGGVFTPTEAAGVAVVYSLFVTMFIYREVDSAGFWRILRRFRLSDLADPPHRDFGRNLFMAA